MKSKVVVSFAALVFSAVFFAQKAPKWTVKPEWVRAHETFLASDALGGRGSATRDEEIAATYVASQFLSFGLKTAPGMDGYIQAGELVSPRLDHHATITAGDIVLREGEDFDLLISPGTGVSGVLAVTTFADAEQQAKQGDAVLVDGLPASGNGLNVYGRLVRNKVAAVIMERDAAPGMLQRLGGVTRTPTQLKDAGEGSISLPMTSLVLLSHDAAQKLTAKKGQPISLAVHELNVPPRKTFNAIGYLPGTDPAAGTILLTAHLDHLGTKETGEGDRIFNGADDDASGTTAVLELARALAAGPKPKRNVLFVCYGSEELGGLGSTFFGKYPPVPLTSLIANLEFEMVGVQDPKMPKGTMLLTGWERSNLGPTLKEHGALLGPDPYPEEHFFQRSDNYSLALLGVVAHTAAGWGTPPIYHQPDDDLQHLDFDFLTNAIQSLVEPVRWLASSDFKPAWNAGGQPTR